MTKTILLPKILNTIVPFSLVPESENERNVAYTIEIRCSDNVKTHIEFSGIDPNICTHDNITDKIVNLNANLHGTYAAIKGDNVKTKDLKINYVIHYLENNTRTITFEQELVVAQEISIHRVNKAIYYQPNSVTAFDLKILEIQESYFRNAQTHEFTIVISNNKIPDWLQYRFENGELYFSGKTPNDLSSSYSFSFMIQDKQTDLFSPNVDIQIDSSIECQSPGGKVLVVILFLIFTGVIACVLFIILVCSRKKTTNPAQLKLSINFQDRPLQDTTTNVLSDSILQWNKKLVDRHKTRTYNFIAADDEKNRPGRSPGFAYEKFDDTFEMTEEDKNPDIRMSDKLSDIRPDDDDHKNRDDENRSSFFDDLRFWAIK